MHRSLGYIVVLSILFFNSAASNAIVLPSLSKAEYFVDVDPGEGKGVPMTLLPGTYGQSKGPITGFIDTGNFSVGLHMLYVRAMDSLGNWGTPRKYPFEVTQESIISAAEWFIDTVGLEGSGGAFSALDGVFDHSIENLVGTIPTDNLSYGIHTLYARARNSSGIWGATRSAPFVVGSLPATQLLGDVNMDGYVDIADVVLIQRIAAGIDSPVACSDVVTDGLVNGPDVAKTFQMVLGFEGLQECGN